MSKTSYRTRDSKRVRTHKALEFNTTAALAISDDLTGGMR
jgi:hypothetical protein